MRIGIFTDTYPPYINGVSTSIQMLERALKKKGHQVFIVTVNPENMTYKYEKNIIRIPGIPTGIYDYRLTGIYPIRAIKTIKQKRPPESDRFSSLNGMDNKTFDVIQFITSLEVLIVINGFVVLFLP